MYDIKGTIKAINETQAFSSGFTKREFVITTEDKYPQDVKLELIKERTALLDDVNEGDTVEVGFYVRGNEYQGKYYVNLQAVKLECTETGQAQEQEEPVQASQADEPADAEADFPF